MNKYFKIAGVVAVVAVIALAGTAVVSAQTPTPPAGGFGPGGMRGQMGDYGVMAQYQDVMHTQIAGALGLTVDEFNAALAGGKTAYTIAQEKGIDFATVQAAMQTARAEALTQAVADGTITQAQADWVLTRQSQMGARHTTGGAPMGQGGRMNGRGGFNCSYPFTTTP